MMALKQIMSVLKENGYKQTEKREEILRIMLDEKRYMTVKEVHAHVHKKYPSLSFDTVYRNLTLFNDLDMLEMTELKGERIYRFRCNDEEHHHHLICLSCGKSRMIDMCPLDTPIELPQEFTVTDHKFELYGYCMECS